MCLVGVPHLASWQGCTLIALTFAYELGFEWFLYQNRSFRRDEDNPVDHFSIRDHLNNLLSPSSTSRSIDYLSLQPGKFSIRVSFPHRQSFYPASFHTGKVSLRQGLYSGKGSSLTRFLPRQDFTPASTGDLSVPARFPRRQAFTPASFHTSKILPRQGFRPGMLLYDRATFKHQHMYVRKSHPFPIYMYVFFLVGVCT